MTYMQPHEAVRGVDRDSFLLSLDPAALEHREALISMAMLLRKTTLVGHPAPIVSDIDKRITSPAVGDLVVEVSVLYRQDVEAKFKGIGILIERRKEWMETDEEWEAAKAEEAEFRAAAGITGDDEDRMTDDAWYIQYGNSAADICRWVNCSFVALPIHGGIA